MCTLNDRVWTEAIWETQVQPWVGKIPPEKEMATHSSILAWEIPWTEEPGGRESMGSQKVGHDSMTNTHWAVRLFFWLFVLSEIHSLPESWAWFFVSN